MHGNLQKQLYALEPLNMEGKSDQKMWNQIQIKEAILWVKNLLGELTSRSLLPEMMFFHRSENARWCTDGILDKQQIVESLLKRSKIIFLTSQHMRAMI